jgi:general secretion pathway protein F
MSAYRYEATRPDGATVCGVLEAGSGPEAAALLSSRGLYPLTVAPGTGTESWWRRARRPSVRAVANVFQGLAALVEAGVPLDQAIHAAERGAQGTLAQTLQRVGTRVREGQSLGSALASEPGAFSGVTIGLVRAGERGVGLAAALAQTAAQLERESEGQARVRAALAYPLLLAVVGSLTVAVIVLFVVPRFAALLGDLGQTLPPATRILLAGSDILRRFGIGLAIGTIIGAVAAQRFIGHHRVAWHAWLLTVPVAGSIRHALATARVARTLGALLGTGTPALVALAIARDAAGDAAVAARLGAARDRVAEGAGLTAALEGTAALAPGALQLARIGEGSGRLPYLLLRAADLEERDAERRLRMLVGLLEPALIIAFAGLVAFVAAALLQAVYAVRPEGL